MDDARYTLLTFEAWSEVRILTIGYDIVELRQVREMIGSAEGFEKLTAFSRDVLQIKEGAERMSRRPL